MNRITLTSFFAVFFSVAANSYATSYAPPAETPDAPGFFWNKRVSPKLDSWLRAVVRGADRWVAAGDNGALFYSLDGETWHDATFMAGDNVFALAWTGSRFVAVGRAGISFSSSDGIVWEKVITPTSSNLNDIAWFGSQLVAVGRNGTIIRSPDGATWSPASSPPPSTFTGNCISSNGTRLVCGGNGVYLSDDGGDSWIAAASSQASTMVDLAWNGSSWLAAGSNSGAWWLTSSSADTWTENRISYNGSPTSLLVDGNRVLIATSGVTTTTAEFGAQGEFILSNDSGTTWQGMTQPFRYAPLAVSKHQGVWIGVGKQGVILRSQDGLNWQNQLLSGLGSWNSTLGGVETSSTRRSLPAPALLTSTLVGTQSSAMLQNGYPGSKPRGAAWNGSKYVAVGSDSVFVSDNGFHWTEQTPSFFQFSPKDVCWTGSQWLIVATFGKVFVSSDALNWTQLGTIPINYPSTVISAGPRIVTIGTSGQIASSSNGLDWSFSDLGTRNLNDIAWNGERYVTVGAYGFAAVSIDGISWTEIPSATTTDLNTVEWHGDRFISIGSTWGRPVLATVEGSGWDVTGAETGFGPTETVSINGDLIAVAGPEKHSISRDGVNWKTRTISIAPVYTAGAWNGRYFSAFTSDGRLLLSPDAREWTEQARFPQSFSGSEVIPVESGFLVVGSRDIYHSSDSFTWEHVYNPGGSAEYLSAAASSGSQWVVVGNSGTILISADLVNWAPASSGTTYPLTDVTWAGNRFVVAGSGGTMLSSPNGVDWSPISTGRTGSLRNLVWNGSTLFVVEADRFVLSSSDFINWRVTDLGSSTKLTSMLWNTDRLVGLATIGAGSFWMESADGAAWTNRSLSFWQSNIRNLVWDGSQYVAIGPYEILASGNSANGFYNWRLYHGIASSAFDTLDARTGAATGLDYAFPNYSRDGRSLLELAPGSDQGVFSVQFSTPLTTPPDVSYFLESSPDLNPGSWNLLGGKVPMESWKFNSNPYRVTVVAGEEHFDVPIGTSPIDRCFFRLRVTRKE